VLKELWKNNIWVAAGWEFGGFLLKTVIFPLSNMERGKG